MDPPPVVLTPALPSELLTYVLAHYAYPTTVLICLSRAVFLASLLEDIQEPEASVEERGSLEPTADPVTDDADPRRHPLLIPTLNQVAASQEIDLAFIPTVTHLRAYLSVFSRKDAKVIEQVSDRPGKRRSFLIVYGLLELHRDTSEWSAQGLGNSLSAVVEAGIRSGRAVAVVEERKEESLSFANADEDEPRVRNRGAEVWNERVPMLNGNVKRIGLENEDGGWSGRTVEVGRIMKRWFHFKKGEWDTEE